MQKFPFHKTTRISRAFLVAMVFILIINGGSGHSDKTNIILRKSNIRWSEIRSDLQQEKTKYQYVGVEKCANVCHNNQKMGFQYDLWKTSAHSGAYKTLISKRAEMYAKKTHIIGNPQESSACLICHTTLGELDSSFLTATYKKEDGVTCEACHKHNFIDKTYLPDEADCLKCHNDSLHKMQKFNFRERSAKISHPRPTELINNH